jgi:SAM-dependent methyltransferase
MPIKKNITATEVQLETSHETALCPVCGQQDISFLPLPDYYHENAQRHGYAYFGKGEMTSLQTYSCSHCGASDRERLCALWIDQKISKSFFPKNTTLIHFALEAALSRKLKQLNFFDYNTADLLMENVDYKIDMMDMPFKDESYDFFICSHVLEHVDRDDQAIRELHRITRNGGAGILMSPIVVGLDKTIEDPSVKDEANRWRLFGQNDHVRLYAHDDYVNKIGSNGFLVEELGERYFGKKVFHSLGLKSTSILYVVTK